MKYKTRRIFAKSIMEAWRSKNFCERLLINKTEKMSIESSWSWNVATVEAWRSKLKKLHACLRRDHPRMRAFSYAWSLPVTWQRWRSHHSIRRTRKPHATRKHHGICLIERELLSTENRNFFTFPAPVTLTLTRWPSHTNLTRSPWRYTACAYMNFVRQGFRKLSSDRHTCRHDQNYIPHRCGWSKNATSVILPE